MRVLAYQPGRGNNDITPPKDENDLRVSQDPPMPV